MRKRMGRVKCGARVGVNIPRAPKDFEESKAYCGNMPRSYDRVLIPATLLPFG